MKTCKKHIKDPVVCYSDCAGCEMQRLAFERDQFKTAYNEWMDKMAWARTWNSPSELGKHIADVIHSRFDQLKAENDALRNQVQSMIDQTTPLVPVAGDPMWSRRITIDELRTALAECTGSLEGSVLDKYHGQQPDDMHQVTRRDYDRDMAEINGYKALSRES